jgi:hypothetical protein
VRNRLKWRNIAVALFDIRDEDFECRRSEFFYAMTILTPLSCLDNLLCWTTALKTAGKAYDAQADAPPAMAVFASSLTVPPPSVTRILAGRAMHVVTGAIGEGL